MCLLSASFSSLSEYQQPEPVNLHLANPSPPPFQPYHLCCPCQLPPGIIQYFLGGSVAKSPYSNPRDLGSIPGQGTRSLICKLKYACHSQWFCMLQWRSTIPRVITTNQCSQINEYLKKKKNNPGIFQYLSLHHLSPSLPIHMSHLSHHSGIKPWGLHLCYNSSIVSPISYTLKSVRTWNPLMH